MNKDLIEEASMLMKADENGQMVIENEGNINGF